jgi:hypothetical protein
MFDLNPPGLGTLVYVDGFIEDAVRECREASLRFPYEFFLKKIISSHFIFFFVSSMQ